MLSLLSSLRPKQWVKNVVVFAGLFFAEDIFNKEKMIASAIAFVLFCFISSSGYLINDIFDKQKDALHPRKKRRPIASGKVSVSTAMFTAMVILFVVLYFAYRLNYFFGIIISGYFLLTVWYSLYLKRVVIVDVMIIASGFIFRAVGGAIAIDERVSSWLILCTLFLSLFLALAKRRAEMVTLGRQAGNVRITLTQYTPQFLDQMINTVTAACLMAYALYTLDSTTVEKFNTRLLILTLPFVIYGLFRYLYLVYTKNSGEAPETAILKDWPILICVLLYAVTVVLIIYF